MYSPQSDKLYRVDRNVLDCRFDLNVYLVFDSPVCHPVPPVVVDLALVAAVVVAAAG